MISVRKASCDDGSRIAKLLQSKYSFISADEAEKAYTHECRIQHFRVAEQHDRVVGLVSWRPAGLSRHGVAELTRIAVDRSVTNHRMIKERLFDVMIAEADYYYKQQGHKLRKVFSMIHADDSYIKEFFLDKGMQQEAVLHNHFHPGTDELVFSLFLA